MKLLILLTISFFTHLAYSGDASFYESLGFSKDGQFYAYTQDGVYDGLGAYWIELGIIDVAQNKYVGRARLGGEDMNGNVTEPHQKPQLLAQLKKQLSFKKYKFAKKARENVLISRPHTDHSIYKNTIFSLEYWAQGGASSRVQTYELLLNEVDAPLNSNNDWCHDWMGNKMIELRLKTEDIYGTGNEIVQDLQIDSTQPKVRACSYDYSINYVMAHDDSLSVVLNFRRPGFEGPDERYMVITGKIKK